MKPSILKQNSILLVNQEAWVIQQHLFHGQTSDTYLVHNDLHLPFILKKFHRNSNAFMQDQTDYAILKSFGVMMPLHLSVDPSQRVLIKQYLQGETVAQMLEKHRLDPLLISKMKDLTDYLKNKGVMLDYHPENFIVWNSLIYYVDYTCLSYDPHDDFDHYGLPLWQPN